MVEPIRAHDVQATFCATLADQWVADGIRHAVVSPGSRSTPMAIAVANRDELTVHVVHDERVAAFTALGVGLSGVPAILLCTSGTAAANFFPAVVEAGLSEVPLIVVTADRPEELRGVGAPQTIDQIELFGGHVRWFHDPGVAEWSGRSSWRPLARDALDRSMRGPVQLNLPFREPLLGQPTDVPEPLADREPPTAPPLATRLPMIDAGRGLILAGGRSGVDEADVAALHEATGWPILADPISTMRHLDGVVTTSESMLRSPEFADRHVPDIVVRIGRPSTSKTLAQWVDRAVTAGASLIQVGGPGRIDPGRNVTAIATMDAVIEAVAVERPQADWLDSWLDADRAADSAVIEVLRHDDELSEPRVARTIADELPEDVPLVVSSSMPVRDHEWFGGKRAAAHSNRGANGIDGVLATARGVAASRGAAAVLIGDLAFVHDSNALVGLAVDGADVRFVVVDNDGGGIFSFLPQAAALPDAQFEQLFGTPLGTDAAALARAYGVPAHTVSTADELTTQLQRPGPWVVRVASTRARNVDVHAALHAAVVDTIAS